MPICNGCGRDSPTTDEHLFQADVARAIVGDRTLSAREARTRLPEITGGSSLNFGARRWQDMDLRRWVRGLLCKRCNEGWAARLEQAAGRHLHDFTDGVSGLDSALMHRWLPFFHLKLFMYCREFPRLREGSALAVLGEVASGRIVQGAGRSCIFLGRFEHPELWGFNWCIKATRGSDSKVARFAVAVRGVLWVLTLRTDEPALGVTEQQLLPGDDGVRFTDLPEVDDSIATQLGLSRQPPFLAEFRL